MAKILLELQNWKIAVFIILFFVAGCGTYNTSPTVKESNLTAGMAKLTIVKNQTTQAEIMETFGPPDLVTHRDDMQIWTYDKIKYDIQSSQGYLTVLVAGVGGGRTRSSSRQRPTARP